MTTRISLISATTVSHVSPARSILNVVGASVFLALASKVSVPFFPVPLTMQTFAVLLVGFALGSRLGLAAVLAWFAQGAAGLPVFAGPAAGLAYFTGPTGGYLAGFVVAVWLTGTLAERGWDRTFAGAAGSALIGLVAIYTLGLLWLGVVLPDGASVLQIGLVPFLAGEALKLGLLACALPLAWRALGKGEG